ncbi:MAG: STAS domain-containing protein [Chloroflexi bacterium]|nr:STAS domain-containing protein [Chloroflexota bacterium]MBU1747269.1 STAS domain-containing protein [Chloroflexota bacterium]MBU1877925.1 STAS domain-containing protein [Chloroflexota bacterium]
MNITITTSLSETGTQILHVHGNIDSNAAQALETALWNLIDAGTTQILVDLHDSNYVSSGALRTFLTAHKEVRQSPGGDLRLYGANEYVQKIFDLAGFTQFLTLAPDLHTAEQGL